MKNIIIGVTEIQTLKSPLIIEIHVEIHILFLKNAIILEIIEV